MGFEALYRSIGNHLAPAGAKARLSILIYHRVRGEVDPLFPAEPTVEVFNGQMACLKSVFNVLPLPEAVQRLRKGTLPARPACITFDDGYADNFTLALPILKKHGLHATFFIATAYLDGGRMFNDTVIETIRRASRPAVDLTDLGLGMHDLSTWEAKSRAIAEILPRVKYLPFDEREAAVACVAERLTDAVLPNDLMLTTRQLRALHEAGMEIGAHTAHHPILAGLNDAATRAEIEAGRESLESLLGSRVSLFAYPNGKPGMDYRTEQAAIVRSMGFAAAVSTLPGVATNASDPFQLPRYTPWSPKLGHFVPQLLNNLRVPG